MNLATKGTMMLWDEAYETGNYEVDKQHKELFRLVEKVIDGEFSGRQEKIDHVVDFLIKYVGYHFDYEEKLMDECDFPNILTAKHKGQHKAFVVDALKLKETIAQQGYTLDLSLTINETVVNWLTDHIMGSDKELADFYKKWMKESKDR